MLLGMYEYRGSADPSSISAWLAEERRDMEASFDSIAEMNRRVEEVLSGSLLNATGVRSDPSKHVYIYRL
jgi:hypothetical protein